MPAGCKQEHTAGATHCGNVGCCHQLSSNLFRLITTLTAEVATTKLRGVIHRDARICSKKTVDYARVIYKFYATFL